MANRFFAGCVAVALAPFLLAAEVNGSATVQKISVVLTGDCDDKVMDEAEGDEDCKVQVTLTPRTPTRTLTFQEAAPGSKKWSTVKTSKVSSGKATFAVTTVDGDDAYRDGTFSFRVTAPAIKGKQKAYISPTLKVDFLPAEIEGDISDDFTDDDASTPTTPKSTTQTTAKPATATTVAHSPGGGSSTATTPTTPGHGATDTTASSVAGANGGTPTNSTPAAGGGSAGWFAGAQVGDMGAYCMANDPSMFVGPTICSNSGIGSPKSLAQFKTLISTITNAAPQYKRNGFCTQAMFSSGVASITDRDAKCRDADAGR
ncbi:MAG: hypothetical protein RI908_220 [Actinomycetota bacterium]